LGSETEAGNVPAYFILSNFKFIFDESRTKKPK